MGYCAEPTPIGAIYTVSTLHFKDERYGSSPRTVGWFQDLDTALSCVRENWGDIYETVYQYAVVERVAPGLYTLDDRDERWFEWKDGAYQECQKPARLEGVCSFSMGRPLMRRYRYRVQCEIEGRKIEFEIVIESASLLDATTKAAGIGKTLGIMLVGPEGY